MTEKKSFNKKSFDKINNPALSFISNQGEIDNMGSETIAEEEVLNNINNKNLMVKQEEFIFSKGYRHNKEYIETKSKRIQLLLQPSVVEAVKKLARENGISVNETINIAIQDFLKKGK